MSKIQKIKKIFTPVSLGLLGSILVLAIVIVGIITGWVFWASEMSGVVKVIYITFLWPTALSALILLVYLAIILVAFIIDTLRF